MPLLFNNSRVSSKPTGSSNSRSRPRIPSADPFNTIDLDVTFTAPSGKIIRIPAFWAGGKTWRARYASPEVGVHSYVTSCTNA